MITGKFDAPAKGKIFENTYYCDDEGNGVLTFVAESDSGGAITPCFDCWGPRIVGSMVRASCVAVSGYAPTADGVLTIYDESEAGETYALPYTTGDNDFRSATTSPFWNGRIRFSINTMGAASKRWKITMITRAASTLAGESSIETGELENDAVTYAKIQNVSATDKVLGRSTAGAGDVEEIPCTAGGRSLISLALGSQGQMLRVNSGATADEYFTRKTNWDLRDGTIFQTFDRATGSRVTVPTSGTIYLSAIPLRVGDVVTSLAAVISVAAVTPTNWWYVLCNSSRVVVAVTADQTTTATGTGEVILNLTSPYTCTADGQFYVGVMFAATVSTPTMFFEVTGSAVATALKAVVPILCGTSDTAQTTPPAVSATLGAITAAQSMFWMRGK